MTKIEHLPFPFCNFGKKYKIWFFKTYFYEIVNGDILPNLDLPSAPQFSICCYRTSIHPLGFQYELCDILKTREWIEVLILIMLCILASRKWKNWFPLKHFTVLNLPLININAKYKYLMENIKKTQEGILSFSYNYKYFFLIFSEVMNKIFIHVTKR